MKREYPLERLSSLSRIQSCIYGILIFTCITSGCETYYYRGFSFKPASNDIKEAERCFKRGEKLYDNDEYEKAIIEFDLAISLNPNHGHAYNTRGLCFYYQNDLDEALKDYNRAIKLLPNQSMGYYNRAMLYCDLAEFDKAIRNYNRAIELDPKRAIIFIGRANVYTGKKEYKNAIKDLDVAIKLDPSISISFHNRGACWYFLGNLEKAISDYRTAIKLDPNDFDNHYNLALALDDSGNTKDALASFLQSADLDPYNAEVRNKIAWMLASDPNNHIHNCQKAIEYAKQAVKLTSETDWDYLDTLARAYAGSGEFKQAILWLRKALELDLDEFSKAYINEKLSLYEQGLLEPEEITSVE